MLKKSLALLALCALIISMAACKPSFAGQRASVIEYLTASNKILNDLDKAVNLGLNSRQVELLNKQIPAYQAAIQSEKSLKVPSIDEVETYHQAVLKFLQDWLAISIQQLADIKSGGGDPQTEGKAFTEISWQFQSSLVSMEAIMKKFNITDPEVGYTFRRSAG